MGTVRPLHPLANTPYRNLDQDQGWQLANLRRTDNHATYTMATDVRHTPLPSAPPGVDGMIAMLESCLGLGEPNVVQSWYNAKFGNLGVNWPWCDGLVTYAAWHSGNQSAVTFGGAYAYTVAHAQRFQQAGKWHDDVAGIQRGDIVFFDWDGSNNIAAIDHVGTVTGVNGADVQTIEGNVANVCSREVRHSDFIVGYGRPAYVAAPPPPPAPADVWVYAGQLVQAHEYGVSHSQPLGYAAGQVKVVQAALNAEVGQTHPLAVDGAYGVATTHRYALWQQVCGYTGMFADGVTGPGSATPSGSLYKLGLRHGFRVAP